MPATVREESRSHNWFLGRDKIEERVGFQQVLRKVVDRLMLDVPDEAAEHGNSPTTLTIFFLVSDGMNQREIATRFGCSRTIVNRRVTRLRRIWTLIEEGMDVPAFTTRSQAPAEPADSADAAHALSRTV